jgi:hypothetical protein
MKTLVARSIDPLSLTTAIAAGTPSETAASRSASVLPEAPTRTDWRLHCRVRVSENPDWTNVQVPCS